MIGKGASENIQKNMSEKISQADCLLLSATCENFGQCPHPIPSTLSRCNVAQANKQWKLWPEKPPSNGEGSTVCVCVHVFSEPFTAAADVNGALLIVFVTPGLWVIWANRRLLSARVCILAAPYLCAHLHLFSYIWQVMCKYFCSVYTVFVRLSEWKFVSVLYVHVLPAHHWSLHGDTAWNLGLRRSEREPLPHAWDSISVYMHK